jgi:hypothetical protein
MRRPEVRYRGCGCKQVGGVQKENTKSDVETGKEINAAIDGRHHGLTCPSYPVQLFSCQPNEQAVNEKDTKHKKNTGHQHRNEGDRIVKIQQN